MIKKSYKNLGRFLLIFSIIASLIVIYISFSNGSFIVNLGKGIFLRTLFFSITCILIILGGISMKNKHPEYYKYQVISGVILLATTIIFDIIPRLIYLT